MADGTQIGDIFSQEALNQLTKTVPEALVELKRLFLDTAASTKTLFQNATGLKELVAATNKLAAAEKALTDANRTLQSAQLANAKAATESAKQNLLDAKSKTEAAKQAKILSDQLLKEQAAKDKLVLSNNSLTDAYRKLDAAHKQAVIEAKNAGIEFGIESEAFKRLAVAANEMRDKLFAVDQQLGFNQRNVGNYKSGFNALSNSINQLTREAPAFANSLQTGFMAISNNFASLQDAITQIISKNKEAKKATLEQAEAARQSAIAQGLANGETQEGADALGEMAAQQVVAAAEGKKGAGVLKQLASSLFSFTTFVSLAVVLLTVYGPAIIEWITNVSEADKVQDKFNENLKESNKAMAEEMGTLIKAQSVLKDNNALRREQVETLENLKQKYPGYFDDLTEESLLTNGVNDAIERQISLLTKRAEQQAASKTITQATETLIEAQQNLNKEYGFFNTLIAEFKNPGVPAGYAVVIDKSNQLKDATEGINKALELSLEPQERRLQQLQKERQYSEQVIKVQNDLIATGKGQADITQRTIALNYAKIASIDAEIVSINALRAATDVLMVSQKRVLDQGELELISQKNRTLSLKEGSKERLESEKREVEIQLNSKRDALRREYGLNQQGLDQNKEFLIRDQNLLRSALEEKASLQERFDKSQESQAKKGASAAAKAESQAERDRKATISAQKELSDSVRNLNNVQLQQEIDINKALFENTQGLLENRLIAYAKYFNAKNEQAARDFEKEIVDVAAFEEQYNTKIKEALATEESNRTNAQKILLIRYEAFQKQRLAITAKYEQQINVNAIDSSKDIAEITTNGFKVSTQNAEELGKRFAALLSKRKENEKKDDDERTKRLKEYGNLSISIAQEVTDTLFTLNKNRIQAEIDQLDLQKTKIEENLAIAIASVKAEGLSEEERTKKIGELEKQAAVDSANIDKEKRKRAVEQARFDKAQTIASIILNTAKAVIVALTEGDPYTKAFRAIAAGAVGAAQLAVASSIQIPSYAEGTDNHPGGPAIVHDNKKGNWYEPEMIKEPGKAAYMTSGPGPQLVDLKKGTTVTPLSQIANMAQLAAMQSVPKHSLSSDYDYTLLKEVNKNLKALTNTVKNKTENHWNITDRGMQKMAQSGNSWDMYINQKLQH